MDLCWQSNVSLLNMLSRLVITFLPRSKRLLISWLQSPSGEILEPPKNKVWHSFHWFPIYFPWNDGTRCHDLSFLNVELKANFFTLLFHFHQEAFSSSSLSAIRVVSSAYLRLLQFLPAILIPACASSSPAFLMIYSTYYSLLISLSPEKFASSFWVCFPILNIINLQGYLVNEKSSCINDTLSVLNTIIYSY